MTMARISDPIPSSAFPYGGPEDHPRSYRRNAFGNGAVTERPMPSKAPVAPAERIRPSVSADVARVAEYMCSDTVIQGVFEMLRNEAVAKLTASPLGPDGAVAREVARYELEALSTIEARLESMAAELRLLAKSETRSDSWSD